MALTDKEVKIVLKIIKEGKGIEDTEKALKDLQGQTQKTTDGFKNMGSSFTKFLTIAAAAMAFKFVIDEAAAAEKAINSLRASVEISGGSWNSVEKDLTDYASQLQATTVYSDEQVMDVMQRLITITGDSSKSWKNTSLVLDMASTGMIGVEGAAKVVAMAMEGNVTALGRFIPELRGLDKQMGENATQAEKVEYAMKILQQKFGGRATQEAKTYSGQMKQLKNQFSDLAETIGKEIIPELAELAKGLAYLVKDVGIPALTWLQNMSKAAGEWAASHRPNAEGQDRIEKALKKAGLTQQWATENLIVHTQKIIENEQVTLQANQEIIESSEELTRSIEEANEAKLKSTQETAGLMADAFMATATGTQNAWDNLAKKMAETMVTEAFKPMASGLNDMLGQFGTLGTVLAGGIGGVIGAVVGGFLGMLGGQSKSTAQLTAEAYNRMVDKTNEKLDEIGREKTLAEKRMALLEAIKPEEGKVLTGEAARKLGVENMKYEEARQKLLKEQLLIQEKEIAIRGVNVTIIQQEVKEYEARILEYARLAGVARDQIETRDIARKIAEAQAELEARRRYLAEVQTGKPVEEIEFLTELTRLRKELGVPFQHGGIVTRPTLAMIGESGPEAVVPLSDAGGVGGVTIIVNTMAYTGDDRSMRALAREIDKALWKEKRIGRTVNAY